MIPDEPPGSPPGGGNGSPCPAGQVPKTNGQGCKPAGQWWDESPDELSTQGQETCDESKHPSPKECYWCDFDTREWKRGWCQPGSGGSGSGSGSGGPKPGSTYKPYVFGTDPIERTIWENIQNTLNGKDLPYSDEVFNANKSALFSATKGQEQGLRRNLDEDLISSGMFRSGQRVREQGSIGRASQKAYTAGVGDILQKKNLINYQAKMDALTRAKGLLDGYRDYLLRSEGNDIARTQGLAQIQLGYASLANQQSMLQQQLASNWNIAQLNQGNTDLRQILCIMNPSMCGGA